MKYAPILILLVLAGCQDSRTRTNQERIERLEHNQLYVDEVIRTRIVSEEHCEWLSDKWKTCSLRGKPLNCLCDYEEDDWDRASFAFQVEAKALELVEARDAEVANLAAEETAEAQEEAGEEDDDSE